jgi:HK97 family phage major capsid protein
VTDDQILTQAKDSFRRTMIGRRQLSECKPSFAGGRRPIPFWPASLRQLKRRQTMASRLKRLQNQQAALTAEMRSIAEKCDTEERGLGEGTGNEKEKEFYASLEKRADETKQELEIEKKLLEREKSLAIVPDRCAPTDEEQRALEPEKKIVPFTIPATARCVGRLKHFTGQNAEEDAYKTGMWFRAIAFRDTRAIRFCKENGLAFETNWPEHRTAQAEGTDNIGGFLTPTILERMVITLREQYGVFRREAKIVQMGSDVVQIPRRLTGLTVYFPGENTAITESNKTWDQVTLTAKKAAVLTKWSTELDEDAIISMGDDLAGEIAYAFSLKEDQCGFLGDGTATYGTITGITVAINDGTHTASVVTATAAHTGFQTLTLDDFNAVTSKLPLYARANAKWYVSTVGYGLSMERLQYAAGGNTVSTIGGGSGPAFMGYPIVFVQVMNAISGPDISKIKVLFGDLTLSSAMGTRRGVMIKTSAERYLELDQLAIVGTERFDIQNHSLGDNTTPGPVIALKTPAA